MTKSLENIMFSQCGYGIGHVAGWPFFSLAGIGFLGILVVALFAIFWVWMLVDAVTRKSKNDAEKIVWVLVIILTHIIGAVIYYLAVKMKHTKKRR